MTVDEFKEKTKNNGLKNIEWGSEEFVEKAETAEKLKEENESMTEYDDIVASLIHGL